MFRVKIDFHFAVLAVEFQSENSAVLQTKIAWLVCHRIDFSAVPQLVEYAILTRHQRRGRGDYIWVNSLLH